jgi:hypothetical protein
MKVIGLSVAGALAISGRSGKRKGARGGGQQETHGLEAMLENIHLCVQAMQKMIEWGVSGDIVGTDAGVRARIDETFHQSCYY